MKISGVLLRFLAAYIGLTVLVLAGFTLAGIKPNSGINVGILIGSVLWPCLAFGEKNGRYFSPDEKRRVVWGMVAIDLALQLAVALPVLLIAKSLSLTALFAATAFVMVLHVLVIYFFVWNAGKMFAKQLAKKLGKVGGQQASQ